MTRADDWENVGQRAHVATATPRCVRWFVSALVLLASVAAFVLGGTAQAQEARPPLLIEFPAGGKKPFPFERLIIGQRTTLGAGRFAGTASVFGSDGSHLTMRVTEVPTRKGPSRFVLDVVAMKTPRIQFTLRNSDVVGVVAKVLKGNGRQQTVRLPKKLRPMVTLDFQVPELGIDSSSGGFSPGLVRPGDQLRAWCRIVNAGPASVESCKVRLVLSQDEVLDETDEALGNESVTLPAWSSVDFTFDLRAVPDDVAAGEYRVGFIVDPDNDIDELNKEDNATVVGVRNLIVESVPEFEPPTLLAERTAAVPAGVPMDVTVTGRADASVTISGGAATTTEVTLGRADRSPGTEAGSELVRVRLHEIEPGVVRSADDGAVRVAIPLLAQNRVARKSSTLSGWLSTLRDSLRCVRGVIYSPSHVADTLIVFEAPYVPDGDRAEFEVPAALLDAVTQRLPGVSDLVIEAEVAYSAIFDAYAQRFDLTDDARVRVFRVLDASGRTSELDDDDQLSVTGRRPLVLVHGWSGVGEYLLRNVPDPGEAALAAWKIEDDQDSLSDFVESFYARGLDREFDLVAVTYPSLAGIDENAAALAEKLERAKVAGLDTVLLAHSMGGLVARAMVENHGLAVSGIITLGTPHRGTPLAAGHQRFSAGGSVLWQWVRPALTAVTTLEQSLTGAGVWAVDVSSRTAENAATAAAEDDVGLFWLFDTAPGISDMLWLSTGDQDLYSRFLDPQSADGLNRPDGLQALRGRVVALAGRASSGWYYLPLDARIRDDGFAAGSDGMVPALSALGDLSSPKDVAFATPSTSSFAATVEHNVPVFENTNHTQIHEDGPGGSWTTVLDLVDRAFPRATPVPEIEIATPLSPSTINGPQVTLSGNARGVSTVHLWAVVGGTWTYKGATNVDPSGAWRQSILVGPAGTIASPLLIDVKATSSADLGSKPLESNTIQLTRAPESWKGNLTITVRNGDAATAGATIKLFSADWATLVGSRQTGASGTMTWNSLPVATYRYEVWNTNAVQGLATLMELWGDDSVTTSTTGTSVTFRRFQPYVSRVVLRDDATSTEIALGDAIDRDTTVRFDVTVRNGAATARAVRLRTVVDRSRSGPYDFDEASESQTIAGNDGEQTFTFRFVPPSTGAFYLALDVQTLVHEAWTTTDSRPWGTPAFTFPTGDLSVTVRNVNSNTVSGATVKLYTGDWSTVIGTPQTTNSGGVATWTAIPAGVYQYEVYSPGASLPSQLTELWGDRSVTLTAPSVSDTFTRFQPYADPTSVVLRSGGSTISRGNSVPYGSTVQIDVTVRSNVAQNQSRSVRVRMLLDRDRSSPYDFDQWSSSQTVTSSASGTTFSFSYTPSYSTTGSFYRALVVETSVNGNWVTTDSWPVDTTAEFVRATANLSVTVRNVNSNTVSGATVKLHTSDWSTVIGTPQTTNSSGVATWTAIPAGVYQYEVYSPGASVPSQLTELWGDRSVTLTAPSVSDIFTRFQPYADPTSVVLRSGGSTISRGDSVPYGSTVQIDVTVRSNVAQNQSRSVRVRMLLDRDRSSPYDFDEGSSAQTVTSSASGTTFSFSYTPSYSTTGSFYRALVVETSVNGSWVTTDSWPVDTTAEFVRATGNLAVTVRNVNSNTVSGASVKLHTSDWSTVIGTQTTNSSGVATWTGIPAGVYQYEVFSPGASLPSQLTELWGDRSATLTAPSTSDSFTRFQPYADPTSVVLRANGSTINWGGPVDYGTTVQVSVTVRSSASQSRTVRVRMLLDRDRSSSYDFDQTSSSQTVTSSASGTTFSFNYTPSYSMNGSFYQALVVETSVNGTWVTTDSWGFGSTAAFVRRTGNLSVTVRNVNSNTVSGASVKLYTSDWSTVIGTQTTNSSGVASWTAIPTGTYQYEVHSPGASLPSQLTELWGDRSVTMSSSGTTSDSFTRFQPYAVPTSVVLRANGSTINWGGSVDYGKTVQVSVTVRCSASQSRTVRVRMLLDRDRNSSYDFDQTSSSQTVTSSASGTTFSFSYTPSYSTNGSFYQALLVETSVNGSWVTTDSWGFGSSAAFVRSTGNLSVTVRNVNSNTVSGASVKLYTGDWSTVIGTQTTSSSGVTTWSGIPTGAYNYEVRVTNATSGLPTFAELWGDRSVTLSGSSASDSFTRFQPHVTSVVLKNNSTGAVINAGSTISSGTTVRAEVTVRNDAAASRSVSVRVIFDRSQGGGYDFDQTSSTQTVSGGGSSRTYTITFTPSSSGTYYRALAVYTSVNGSPVETDSWPWGTAFVR
jgi:pimeloyl-ACP methyl ester carboxylesterase